MTDDTKTDSPKPASEADKKEHPHQTDQIGHKDIDHKDSEKKGGPSGR